MFLVAPLGGAAIGAGTAWWLQGQPTEQVEKVVDSQSSVTDEVQDTFRSSTIQDYIQVREELNNSPPRYVTYSRLHKQPLATHSLITKELVSQEDTVKQNTPDVLQQKNTNSTVLNKHQAGLERIFANYSRELIREGKCSSVDLIEGPLFNKSTEYKLKDQEGKEKHLDQVYKTTISMDADGHYKTNYFYEIVVCNTPTQHYLNGFVISKRGDSFHPLSRITSLLEIQERTGLTFGVQGDPLTMIDYERLNKNMDFPTHE